MKFDCGLCGVTIHHQCTGKAPILIHVPGQPMSSPRAVLNKKNGNLYMNPEYKSYKRLVAGIGLVKRRDWESFVKAPWDLEMQREVYIHSVFSNYVPRDLDNVEKSIMDALTPVLWSNDTWKHFRMIVKTCALDRNAPRVEITVI